MARGSHSGRGGKRGAPRGRSEGRGSFTPRGRGGRGRGGYDPADDGDFTIYEWAENGFRGGPNVGPNSPRGRGRGRGGGDGSGNASGSGYSTPRGSFTPRRGFRTPRGGFDSPRGGRGGGRGGKPAYKPFDLVEFDGDLGRGRGSHFGRGKRGFPSSRGNAGNWKARMQAVFVRSVHTATLFQEEEEILKPSAEDPVGGEVSHVPTAERVARVFEVEEDAEADSGEISPEERLEEIDFSEIGRIQAEVDAAAATGAKIVSEDKTTTLEERFTGFYVDTTPADVAAVPQVVEHEIPVLGEDDDEVIVYVAPHPRAGPVTPPPAKQPELFDTLPPASTAEDVTPSTISGSDGGTDQAKRSGVAAPSTVSSITLSTISTSSISASDAESSPRAEVRGAERGPPPTLRTDAPQDLAVEQISVVQHNAVGGSCSPEASPAIDAAPAASTASKNHEELTAQVVISQGAGTTETKPGPFSSQPIEEPSLGNFAFSTLKTTTTRKFVRKVHPAHTPRSLIKRSKARRKGARGFGSYGASLAEAHLQEEAKDLRKAQRRQGDSDLDWGDESDGGVDVEELSADVGAMEIDSEIDIKAMSSFVKSMSVEGSRTVTMDDIADMERMRQEDEEDEHNSSEDEDKEGLFMDAEGHDDVVKAEEEFLVAEGELESSSDDSDDEDDDDTDNEETPRRGFQARLQRIRANAKGKARAVAPEDDEADEDFDMDLEQAWADDEDDEDEIDLLEAILDTNDGNLTRKDRKMRDQLFRLVQNGSFSMEDLDDYEELIGRPAARNKDKGKGLPKDLEELWMKDRQKKAENKQKRALARLVAAADPLVTKKGGKKGRKAALLAARLDDTFEIPNRIVDIVTLEQQIRRFLADLSSTSMALPPCNKQTRVKIHELANAFTLKSQSKGKGNTRYTTLTKTTRSGMNINERKVRRILRSVNPDWEGPERGGKGKTVSLAKHREGEEVGKAAPKIGETNIGYKLLASMGWNEGDRIGLSGGLDAPLTAKMKKTKLGLGATL